MESLGTAVLELIADVKPLEAGLAKGKVASEEMARTTATGFRGGIQKAAIPAALAVGALAVGLHHAVDAAEADQVAQERLAKVFEASHVPIGKYEGAIAGAVQKSADLGFKSEDTKKSLGSLMVATKDVNKSMELLATAQDIARFKGIGLEQATKMLVMAQTGSQRATKQLGLTVQASTDEQDKVKQAYKDSKAALDEQYGSTTKMTEAEKDLYDAKLNTLELNYKSDMAMAKYTDKQVTAGKVVDLVNHKLHGQAEAFAETGEGAREKMGAELNLLSIQIGHTLLPVIEVLIHGMATLAGWFSRHATIAKILITVIGTLGTVILLLAAYAKIAALAQWALNTAMDANPIGLLIIAIGALVVAFIYAWKHSETFRNIMKEVFGTVKSAVLGFVHFFTRDLPAAFNHVLNWVKTHWPLIVTFISGPFAPIVALATNAFGVRSALIGAFTAMWNFAKGLWKDLGSVWGAAWRGAWGIVKGIINYFIGGINALISAWDALHFHFGGVSVFGHHFGSFDIGVPQIPQIPYLASGGIVTKPTLAMIGEAGPEAVIPLKGDTVQALARIATAAAVVVGDTGGTKPKPPHEPNDSIIGPVVDWLFRRHRFALHDSFGYHGIATRRFQEAWFDSNIGRGISRAKMEAIKDWWEQTGFYGQRRYRRQMGLPLLAQGGIVSRPTLAMIGEAGPEAVIPLGKGRTGGVVINVSGVVGNESEVAARIGRELQKLKTRGLDFQLA